MILHVARREWVEQARHPALFVVCGSLLVLLAALSLLALGLLQLVESDPQFLRTLANVMGSEAGADAFRQGAVTGTLTAWNFLVFSQYLGFVGVMAGHGLLHDRQSGTLPFLLLAPIGRPTLILGKVLGALGPLTALYLAVGILGGLGTLALPVAAGHPALGPRSAGWWIAILAAGPAWAAFVATACAVISAVARDVRLAQQGVWFVVFFVQLLVAFLITGSLGSAGAQLGAATLGLLATGLAVGVGSAVLAADLGR